MERDLAHRARVYCVVLRATHVWMTVAQAAHVSTHGSSGGPNLRWPSRGSAAAVSVCFVLVEARGVGSRGYYTVS